MHGYAEAGNALVTGGVNKVIFVGSTGVGKAVMQVRMPLEVFRQLGARGTRVREHPQQQWVILCRVSFPGTLLPFLEETSVGLAAELNRIASCACRLLDEKI